MKTNCTWLWMRFAKVNKIEDSIMSKYGSTQHRNKISKALKKFHAKSKHWISGAIKHPGALHKELDIPEGEKIPQSTLKRAAKSGGVLGRRARLAETLRGFKH